MAASRTLRGAAVLAIIAVVSVVWVVHRTVQRSQTSNEWVVHTEKVLTAIESVLATIVDADTAVRSGVSSADARNLTTLGHTARTVDAEVSRLAALTAANPNHQALPSAGLSSSIVVAQALGRRQLRSGAVKASVLVNIASYHMAYVVALLGALVMLQRRGDANALVMVTAVLFLLFSLGLSVAVLVLSGHRYGRPTGILQKIPGLSTIWDFMSAADVRLVRSPQLLSRAVGLQGAIVLLDAATFWVLIRALGVTAPAGGVFISFMIASLFRTMGIVPGGLGTFEATSVLMLRMVGIDVAVALSATLLFRGLSFWLPMLPGYWCSHRLLITPEPM